MKGRRTRRCQEVSYIYTMTGAQPSLLRRPETALFVLAFGVYAYFFQAGAGTRTRGSRWCARSSSSAPWPSTTSRPTRVTSPSSAAGSIARRRPGCPCWPCPSGPPFHPLAHGERPRGRLIHLAAYLATVLTVSLPSAVAVVLLFRIAVRLGTPPPASAAVAAAYAFATLAPPVRHALLRAPDGGRAPPRRLRAHLRERAEGPTARRLVVVGVLLGYADRLRVPHRPPGRGDRLYAAAVVRPGRAWAGSFSARRCRWLDSPSITPSPLAVPSPSPYAVSADPNRQGGLFVGITPPDPRLLLKILFSTERGLLHHTPWLVLALPGLVGLIRRRADTGRGLDLPWPRSRWVSSSTARSPVRPTTGGEGAGMGTRVLVPWLPSSPSRWRGSPCPNGAAGHAPASRASRPPSSSPRSSCPRRGGWCSPPRSGLRSTVWTTPSRTYYPPLWRADKVAVNTVPFHSGNNDPKSAWNLGELHGAGVDGHRCCLWPCLVSAGAAWLAWTVRTAGGPFDRLFPAAA